MGGDFIGSNLVAMSTGIDFVKAVIQVALGQEPDLKAKISGGGGRLFTSFLRKKMWRNYIGLKLNIMNI